MPTLAQSSPCKSTPSHVLDPHAALGFLEAGLQRIAQLAVTADLAAPVPGCPDWTLADVVRHVHRFNVRTADMVERLSQQPLPFPEIQAPARVEEYGEWFTAGAARLLQVLREADPEAPMYSYADTPRVSFWIRRALHEVTVHRLDAERAAHRVEPVDPAVAVDGIDEFLENLPFLAHRLPARDLHGDGETIHLHATDLEDGGVVGEWLITLEPHGYRWSHAHVKGAAAVRGTVADLLLFIYGRKPAADPSFLAFGDSSLVTYWSTKTVF